MGRSSEQQRGRLAALQEMVAGSGQALLVQAQSIADGLQRRLAEVSRDVGTVVETSLRESLDDFISRLALSIRRELEGLSDRLDAVEERLSGLPAESLAEVLEPVRSLAEQAIESAAASNMRLEQMGMRLQDLEQRLAEGENPSARGEALVELRNRLAALHDQVVELGREVGSRVAEVAAVADRLARIEGRIADQTRELAGQVEIAASLRERIGRLESRVSDLSREQVARSVEAAGLRERLLRLEHRSRAPESAGETAYGEKAEDEG